MTRPAPHRLLACLLVVVMAGLVTAVAASLVATPPALASPSATTPSATSSARAAEPGASTPLRVTIRTLAPATIPRRGRITLHGRIVNQSKETWSDLNVYLLTSETPLRTRAELADAAGSAADTEVGGRLAAEGLFDRVGDLAPGDSVPYRLSVRRADLEISGEPGVYWVGVHVLGASSEGRDLTADGRARTFMPLLPAPGSAAGARDRTRMALLVPIRKPVQRGSAGRLVDPGSWADTLGPGGRLDRLLSLTGRARQPITWVVDPALLDAVRSMAQGNPTADPAPGPGAELDEETPNGAVTSKTDRRAARNWLREFRRQVPTHTVASVPYGTLDVAAALSTGMRSLYRLGVQLSSETLAQFGVDGAMPVVDPASGFLPSASLAQVEPGSPVVLKDAALPRSTHPVVRRDAAPPVVLTDTDAESGGPAPNSQYAALAVRQRLLSDAALHALSADRDDPLVVSMPEYWNPGDAWAGSRFFRGLETPWLQLVDLPSVVAFTPSPGTAEPDSVPQLVYPESDRADRVPLSNLQATRGLVRAADAFARLLNGKEPVADRFSRVAMLASSSAARADPELARRLVLGSTASIRAEMSQVRVEGPEFVMMSGESGPIQVTLVNGLQQSVTVGLKVSTSDPDLRIADVAPVTLGPGRRTSVRLEARSGDIGVHAVTLTTTDAKGVSLGTSTRFSVRTSNVSTVIWVIMAVGGVLLFLAIAVRLIRRVQVRRATHGPRLRREMRA